MKKKIVIFEVEGGTDKSINGLRKDTMPIIKALKKRGWACEVIYFRDEWKDEIITYTSTKYSAFISRINPGNLVLGEKIYFETLRELHKLGLIALSHPDEMLNLGSKDLLVKLAGSPLVPTDTFAYYSIQDFKKNFPITLSKGIRVLKQNRGSTGVGIWKVELFVSDNLKLNQTISINRLVKCTEAINNITKVFTLDHFMKLCEKYILGENGLLIDLPYLFRIKEGELRILMVGEKPIHVVRKKPSNFEEAFSATLFSGATYSYHDPSDFKNLIAFFQDSLPKIKEVLKSDNIPLIWTADFILSNDSDGYDSYILSEVNCTCVGFSSLLESGIQDLIAIEAISRIKKSFSNSII